MKENLQLCLRGDELTNERMDQLLYSSMSQWSIPGSATDKLPATLYTFLRGTGWAFYDSWIGESISWRKQD